jgi:hypothetical protein
VSVIPDRLEGVALGGALALVGAVLLWPEPEHPHTLPQRAARSDRRCPVVRLLGREHPLGGGAVVGRDQFAGVLAFIFADLIVLPIIAIYRKYYGTPVLLLRPLTARVRNRPGADRD